MHERSLRYHVLALRAVAPVFLLVALLHLVLGVRADALLGAQVPEALFGEPSLNSQNRFYGVSFALYGVLLWIGAGDLPRYRRVLAATWWVFLAAGLARVLSWHLDGAPSAWVIVLTALELLLPPLMLAWQRHALGVAGAGSR
jgi:hypothetical protein